MSDVLYCLRNSIWTKNEKSETALLLCFSVFIGVFSWQVKKLHPFFGI